MSAIPFRITSIVMLLGALLSCQKEEAEYEAFPALMQVPAYFPEVPQPADNHFTVDRWNLGRKLFYDPLFQKTVQSVVVPAIGNKLLLVMIRH